MIALLRVNVFFAHFLALFFRGERADVILRGMPNVSGEAKVARNPHTTGLMHNAETKSALRELNGQLRAQYRWIEADLAGVIDFSFRMADDRPKLLGRAWTMGKDNIVN